MGFGVFTTLTRFQEVSYKHPTVLNHLAVIDVCQYVYVFRGWKDIGNAMRGMRAPTRG
jgi:hypothetical protein